MLLEKVLLHFKEAVIIIDNVYFASLDETKMQELAKIFQRHEILQRSIFIDSEWKAKASTGKRSGAVYTKNKEYCHMIADVLRNWTGWCPSSMMVETIAKLQTIDDSISSKVYAEVRRRRESFLEYIFSTDWIKEYLEPQNLQYGLPYGYDWTWWLYAFIRLKEGVDCTQFILKTWLIGSPWNVFWAKKYGNYVRFSFGFEDFTLKLSI